MARIMSFEKQIRVEVKGIKVVFYVEQPDQLQALNFQSEHIKLRMRNEALKNASENFDKISDKIRVNENPELYDVLKEDLEKAMKDMQFAMNDQASVLSELTANCAYYVNNIVADDDSSEPVEFTVRRKEGNTEKRVNLTWDKLTQPEKATTARHFIGPIIGVIVDTMSDGAPEKEIKN